MKRYLKLSVVLLSLILSISLCSCSVALNQEPQPLVKEIVSEIQKQCELPVMEEVSEYQLGHFYNIDKTDVAYFSALVSTDSMSKDEIILIEALTESEANAVRDRLNEHYDNLLSETKEYLPDEYEIIKNCKVVKDGIYIRLFISKDADKMEDIYNSYMQP
ncbi:MAG: DUF4358 domain-containing protein [Acutalibacteraceae bacterium]|nr:DUF4358 domain-containing protein [Acutalibacteraceae bacterium]